MPRKAVVIRLIQSDQEVLPPWVRSGSVEHRLHQIEIWFSILSRQALKGASFTSVGQLREAIDIDAFMEEHNERAAPFEWTKKEVFPLL